jgi:hypothetical protein
MELRRHPSATRRRESWEHPMSDLLDFLWNLSQERQLRELRNRLDQTRLEHDLAGGDRKMLELATENMELKQRLGLLVRLLISKGVLPLRSTRV